MNVDRQSDNIEPQQIRELYADLLELSNAQLSYVVVETTVVSHERLWRALGGIALLCLFLSSSYTPMNARFDPSSGLIALFVVACILAAAAYLLRRKK